MSAPQFSRSQRNALDRLFDRIEDRLLEAPEGMHRFNEGCSEKEVLAQGIDLERGFLWTRWNGMELGQGEVEVLALAEIAGATEAAQEQGLLRAGDRVVGRRAEDLYVFPQDPFEEGADVLLVDARKQRGPLGSTPGHWLLALLGEFSIVYGYDGEYREELFDVHSGEMRAPSERRILRRRLDLDPDSALTRFELAQSLMRTQEFQAAATELRRAIRCAPEFAWSHLELGRALQLSHKPGGAIKAFGAAAELFAAGSSMRGLALASAARLIEEDKRSEWLQRLQREAPRFAAEQIELAQELLDEGDVSGAEEAVELARVVAPRNLAVMAMLKEIRAHRGPDSSK